MIALSIFLCGLVVGSFLNVVVYRLHANQSLLFPRSYCPACRQPIGWYDNIPVLSFLLLGGRCRHCRQKISWQYPLIELSTALIFLALYLVYGVSTPLPFLLVFASFLIVIFVYDLRYYFILDQVTVPAMVFGLAANLYLGHAWTDLALGAALGGGFFAVQYVVSHGRWIGDGDIRLGVLMGLLLGWRLTLVAVFLAYLVGAIVGIALIAFQKKKLSSAVPFGTFLSAATIITFLYGEALMRWYLGLLLYG